MLKYTEKYNEWCIHKKDIQFEVIVPIRWEVGRKGSGWNVDVETGFHFDVSVPWFARFIFNPLNPKYLRAAAVHDKMLIMGNDRKTSGASFYDALRASGVGYLEAHIMWFFVSMYKSY